MLQAANTDLFNPVVPKTPYRECQNLLVPLQIKPVIVKASLRIFIFCALGSIYINIKNIVMLYIKYLSYKLYIYNVNC